MRRGIVLNVEQTNELNILGHSYATVTKETVTKKTDVHSDVSSHSPRVLSDFKKGDYREGLFRVKISPRES